MNVDDLMYYPGDSSLRAPSSLCSSFSPIGFTHARIGVANRSKNRGVENLLEGGQRNSIKVRGGFCFEFGVSIAVLITTALKMPILTPSNLRLGVCVFIRLLCFSCALSPPARSGPGGWTIANDHVGLIILRFYRLYIAVDPTLLLTLLTPAIFLSRLAIVFRLLFGLVMLIINESVLVSFRSISCGWLSIKMSLYHDRSMVGLINNLFTYYLPKLKSIKSSNSCRQRVRRFFEVIGTIFILFSLSPQLAPILGVLMLAVSISIAVYKRSTLPVFKAHGMAQASISDCVTETFSAIRTVRSFGGEKRQLFTFASQVLSFQSSGIKLASFKSVNESLTRVAVYISLTALYCLGGSKVKAGELSVGTMASFIGYTFTLTFAVQGLVNTFGDLRGTLAAVERINSVLSGAQVDDSLAYGLERELKQKTVDDENYKLVLSNISTENGQKNYLHYMSALKTSSNLCNLAWSGDICLEDVYFSYPLRPDVEILSGINLRLKCGTVTALVGPSGAGKSTVVQLLSRFYEPTRGCITVAGEDVRTFDKSEWARVVSIVNQEPVLFSVSVGENIAYGLPDEDVSKEDVIKAAKAANAHDFIISLPQGYDTLVGERGGLLSGGQRQRIAIARALLKNAPILILDEATSALDAVSERLVQDALNHLMKGRTTLVIAHRLSTVQNAYQIAVCSEGRVAELGTHFELLAKKGQYASLVGTQRLAFE
ncbi:hypothetical protein Fmac_015818 [Flemingia macrophylla]|uniref:ABC transporter B family member 28 n=1 Tax=Flemingia macrophylla TaxID=520843 RepID=A0ABD1MFM4_9FABA